MLNCFVTILIIVSATSKISPLIFFLCRPDANANGCYGNQQSIETYQAEIAIYIYIYFTYID